MSKPRPIAGILFDYPIHKRDDSGAVLASKPKSNQRTGGKAAGQLKHEDCEARKEEFVKAYSYGITTLEDMKKHLGMGNRTVRDYAKELGYIIKRGTITKKLELESS